MLAKTMLNTYIDKVEESILTTNYKLDWVVNGAIIRHMYFLNVVVRICRLGLPKALLLTGLLMLDACAPVIHGAGQAVRAPELNTDYFVTADNVMMPVRHWGADLPSPRAVIIALHGFNDYSNAFDEAGNYWAANRDIATYAYDQRGFGDAGVRGTWAGTETYVQDLREFCNVLRRRYPNAPLYVLGESMGGAIAMVAFTSADPPNADGVILSAPAVWARSTMPWYQRAALFVGAHTIPWMTFTGENIDVVASDNRDMLIALGRDPKVIKATKVSAMYGLTNLMDAALASAGKFSAHALIMIGDRDEIVPNKASATMLADLPATSKRQHIAIYDQGYHMLLRDLDRKLVWNDVAAWINTPQKPLPSEMDEKDVGQWVKSNL